MLEAEVQLDADHPGTGVDRDRKRGLAGERTIVDHADNHAAHVLQGDGRAIGQCQRGIGRAEHQRIAEPAADRRTIGAEQRAGIDHRGARVAGRQDGTGRMRVVALDDQASVDRCNRRRTTFVNRDEGRGIERRGDRDTIVKHDNAIADRNRAARLVAVEIGQ